VYTFTVCICLPSYRVKSGLAEHSMLQLASNTWAIGSSSRGEGRLFRSDNLSTSLRHNMNSMAARPTYCPIVAALAAPITPHPATKTKNKSRLRLTAFAAALAISGVLHHTTVHSLIACRSIVSTRQTTTLRSVAVAAGHYQTRPACFNALSRFMHALQSCHE